MNDTKQPDPLQLAQLLESFQEAAASAEQRAAAELRRLHAENLQLRADLEAVGAGGIGPLIPATVQHQREPSSDNELQRKTGDLITTAAPPQSGGIPPNWKMVPVEPNEAMHRAAVRTVVHCTGNDDFPPAVYRAMLAAAPQPPASKDPNWPKLEKPARVGGGTFGIGTSSKHVVDAAQRAHDEHVRSGKLTHEQLVEEERKRRALWDMINGSPEESKPQFVWQAQGEHGGEEY